MSNKSLLHAAIKEIAPNRTSALYRLLAKINASDAALELDIAELQALDAQLVARVTALEQLQESQATVSRIAALTTSGAGTGATGDIVSGPGAGGLGQAGTGMTVQSAYIGVAEPGSYFVEYIAEVTDLAGGESLQGYVNGAADGSTGAVGFSRFGANYTAGDRARIVGSFWVTISDADIAAGPAVSGTQYAAITIRNVSGANVTLPALAAGGNAVDGTNFWMRVQKFVNG